MPTPTETLTAFVEDFEAIYSAPEFSAVTAGANTDAARAAILPHLQMEVDGLKKHGKEYISNLI